MIKDIDETTLNKTDRLGLAYCRLSSWQWDDIVGLKPYGFDDMPWYYPKRTLLQKIKYYLSGNYKKPTKAQYIDPAIRYIEFKIGRENMSRCHWLFVLGKTEIEWRTWYESEGRQFFETLAMRSQRYD